jgi:hypothetical protein
MPFPDWKEHFVCCLRESTQKLAHIKRNYKLDALWGWKLACAAESKKKAAICWRR